MSFSFKSGVRIVGLRPEMAAVLPIIAYAFKTAGYRAVITCGTEGRHGKSSKHYTGLATDWRTKRLDIDYAEAKKIADAIKTWLTDDFDVVVHDTHIHVEFDPKVGVNL